MEEIYKPDSETGKIDLYNNRESSDILGDIPRWLTHTGSYIVYGIIAFFFLGASLFSYPDVVRSIASIDDAANVEWITANRSGMMDHFFVENQSQVKRNDTLGILKNTASLDDVKRFCRVLTNVEWYYRTNDVSYLQRYPFDLIMGDMTDSYRQFTQAVRTCVLFHEFDLYPQKVNYLKEELDILNRLKEANELTILKKKREMFDLEIEHKMEIARNKRLLELAYENMVNSLKTWESNYLIKTRSDGIVLWGKSWGMSNAINEGDTLCTVMSGRNGNPVGHIRLSQEEVAGLAPGNKVNIELSKYPAHTYGYLIGEVSSISYVPYNKKYAVEISFPQDLMTSNKKQIAYEVGLSGKAEIITSSRTILSRLLSPLFQLFE